MIAKLTDEKILRRETLSLDRVRPVMIEIHPRYLKIKAKGLYESYTIAWDRILDHLRIKAAMERLEASKGERRRRA